MNKKFPNYRVSVEIILLHDDKVLIMKRAHNEEVAPEAWNVPAGKVEYDEIPTDAAIRECKEETGIDVRITKEVQCRTFQMEINGEKAFRLLYTHLVKPLSNDFTVTINDEHSEFTWVNKQELANEKYDLLPQVKDIINLQI